MLSGNVSPQAVPGSFYASRALASLEYHIGCVKDVPLLACMCGGSCHCMHQCVVHCAPTRVPMWKIIHLHACRHDILCNGMHTYVAHNATVCMLVWQAKHNMHTSVADTACVAKYATV